MNKIVLTGYLANEKLNIYDTSVGKILHFTIGVIENKKSSNFVEITCFDKLAIAFQKYIKQGDLVEIEGRIQSRSFLNADGIKTYKTEIIANNIIYSTKSKKKSETSLEKFLEEIKNDTNDEKEEINNQYGFALLDDEE